MGTVTKEQCLRCRDDCVPLANLSSDEGDSSFVCVGYNKKENREVKQDRFTLCWKNSATDELGHWDKRDLIDTVSVITQALSIDENIRVSGEMSEDQMNDSDFLSD